MTTIDHVKTMLPFQRILSLIVTIAGVCISHSATAENLPQKNIDLTESWRWRTYDSLKNKYISCGTELTNGKLLFVTDNSIIIYDGYTIEEVNFPKEYEGIITLSVWAKSKDLVYLNTSEGLIVKKGDHFQRLLFYQHYYPEARNLFISNDEGLLITVTPGGIYSLKDDELTQLNRFDFGIASIIHTGNQVFMATSRNNAVYSCDFSSKGISNYKDWKKHQFEPASIQSCFLYEGNEPGEVIALNYLPYSGIHKFNPAIQSWETINNKKSFSDKRFISGISTGLGSELVFEKTSAFVVKNSQWTEIEKRTYNQPINGIFSFKKKNGNLIIGGRGDNVMEIDLSNERLLSYDNYHYICDDLDNRHWFLSREGNVVSQNIGSKVWIQHEENVIDSPTTVLCSDDGIVWVAGAHKGIASICRYDGLNWILEKHPKLGKRISHLAAIQLSDGRILFGSGDDLRVEGDGLVVYQKRENVYEYETYANPIVPARVFGLLESPEGTIWCTNGNLFKLDFLLQKKSHKEDIKATWNWIDDIQPGSNGKIYVALWDKGLLYGNSDGWEQMTNFNQDSGHLVSHILNDEIRSNTLWLTTERGVAKLDMSGLVSQILPSPLSFFREEGTIKQDKKGSIWINQTNRSWYFSNRKDRIQSVNNFKTYRYQPENQAPHVEIISFGENRDQSSGVYFKWKGMDKWSQTPDHQLRYSYQINDADWTKFTNQTEVILSQTPSNLIRFNVRVQDLDGNVASISEPVTLEIHPPIWKRAWFIILLIFTATLTGGLILLLIRQRIRHVLELDELKLQFFTNISHELRTPLMLIIAPLETLLEELTGKKQKEQADIAYRNSKKMLHLVDQILEFRRIEFAGSDSTMVKQDLIKDLHQSINLHSPLALEKKINILKTFDHQKFECVYDSDKIDRILSNLLSNAIKYTPEKGTILIKTRIENESESETTQLHLMIEDDGEGIGSDKLKHIFEPFYRVPQKTGKRARGVGLGLSLVKNLLDNLGGEISVESPVKIENGQNKGSRFCVKLPINTEQQYPETQLPTEKDDDDPQKFDSEKKWVLIVEDEKEIREYLGNSLHAEYSISYAENGSDGLKKAKSIIPDFILTDILMPEMDGFEFIEQVRREESTSHIPIIALTALNSTEHELKALNNGANDFLSKPVSIKILKQKIKNAISSQELQQKIYQNSSKTLAKSAEPVQGSVEDRFMEKVNMHIEKNIEDPFFVVDNLSAELSMSRMTLYRKVKAITGMSPSELIRITRLQKAAQLLIAGEFNISEIADRTGYQDRSHFSTSFKKHFGCKPSQYVKKQQDI